MDSPRSRVLRSSTRREAHRPNPSPYVCPTPTAALDCATAIGTDAAMTTANNVPLSPGMKRHAAALAVAAGLLAGASPAATSAEAQAAPEARVVTATHLYHSPVPALTPRPTVGV